MNNVIVERYPVGVVKTRVFEKPFPSGVPSYAGRGVRGQSKNPEKSLSVSLSRTKKKIFDLILSNKWEYWATQTFNSIKVDRYDLDQIINKFNKRLLNLRNRKYDFSYLLIPELHKDGAIHLHGFFMGIPDDKIVYSGYDYYNKKKQFSRPVYNWVDVLDFGFNDFVKIDTDDVIGYLKMAKYCTKYITKDLIKDRFNRKKYWASKGLNNSIKYKTSTNVYGKDLEKWLEPDGIISSNTYYLKDEKGNTFNKLTEVFSLIGNYSELEKNVNLFV